MEITHQSYRLPLLNSSTNGVISPTIGRSSPGPANGILHSINLLNLSRYFLLKKFFKLRRLSLAKSTDLIENNSSTSSRVWLRVSGWNNNW